MMDAIRQIVEEQAVKVMPLVRAKVPHDDFDDVMQDIRISFLISLPHHRGEAQLSTYAYSIARRRIADYWRKKYRGKKPILAMIENYGPKMPVEPIPENGKGEWLSPMEKVVFRLLGQGMSNAEIAEALFRGISTIRTHVKRIYKKLSCCDRVKVALLASDIFGGKE